MTAFEFIYLIGFNVSFLMALCVFINDDELKKEIERERKLLDEAGANQTSDK